MESSNSHRGRLDESLVPDEEGIGLEAMHWAPRDFGTWQTRLPRRSLLVFIIIIVLRDECLNFVLSLGHQPLCLRIDSLFCDLMYAVNSAWQLRVFRLPSGMNAPSYKVSPS
jgi:hypothetical protein